MLDSIDSSLLYLPFEQHPQYQKLTMKKNYRFLILFLSCIYLLGNYYCYDEPAAIEIQLERDFNISQTEFGWLYSVYAIPNIILPFIGGVIFDTMGTRKGLMIYTVFVIVGQGAFTLGGSYQDKKGYILMLVGRCIFGIGCEGMYVGQSLIIA